MQVAKEAVEQTAKAGLMATTKATFKMAANPVGIAADFAQAGLELAGKKDAGKAVGATGNIASGAMTGFVLGGPLGAGVGAAAGYGLWFMGEVVGEIFNRSIN